MFSLALAFLVGHCVLHSLARLPPSAWTGAWAAIAVAATGLLFLPRARSIAALVLALLYGFANAWWHAEMRMDERWPAARSGDDIELRGFIASIVERREDGQRFLFDVADPGESIPKHIELTWYDNDIALRPGEFWRLRARLRTPHGFANPGGYDYEAQLLREDIGATGYVRDAAINGKLESPRWRYPILRVRAAIAERLADALPDSSMLGIIEGLAIGDTSRMRREQWRVFANTGTTHLMAISGMHIGMVALLVAYLTGRIVRILPLQAKRIGIAHVEALAGMSAALAYSALAGLSVPTQRTLIMLCVYFGARLLRREVKVTQGLAIALTAVLMIDPFAPLAPGFWLSFGAVGALFLAGAGRIGLRSKPREFLHAQSAVTVGLAPLLIGAFGNLSLIAPIVNVFAIPFFTLLIVPLVLTATSLIWINTTLGSALLQATARLLEWIWPALDWASRAPLALWPLPRAPWWAFALLTLGAFVILAPGVLATRLAGLLLCLPALCWQPPRPSTDEFQLAMLDVGQGLAVVVRTATHVLVYDMGPAFRGGRDTGELVVAPYLHALGVRAIDVAVASHGDADHVGGLESVLSAFPTARLLIGPSVRPQANSEICHRGQTWTWDGIEFAMLAPRDELDSERSRRGKRRNNTSCVLSIRGPKGGALLLGDIEAPAEAELISTTSLQHTDIVVVPHHGSRTSSSPALIAATSPRYALISAGFGNRFGFPKEDVVARWRGAGAEILGTAAGGAITITASQAGVDAPRAYRVDERRYWRE